MMKCSLFIMTMVLNAQADMWTWLYKKNFLSTKHDNKVHIVFSKTDISPFTQMICSWNAHRPKIGYFSFSIQVRDAISKKWHDWLPMYEWGAHLQRSFFNKTSSGIAFSHVRLDVPKGHADGVRLRIQAHDNASMSDLKSIAINTVDFNKFKAEDANGIHFPSFKVKNVPLSSQMLLEHPRATSLCSPTSGSMLISYLNQRMIDPLSLAEKIHDPALDIYGNWPFNTAALFELSQGSFWFRVKRLSSFAELYAKLKEEIPVIVSVRGKLNGAPQEYNNGHLLVIVGWDEQQRKVLCHDPAFPLNELVYVEYDIAAFCTAWERSRRLAYLAERI